MRHLEGILDALFFGFSFAIVVLIAACLTFVCCMPGGTYDAEDDVRRRFYAEYPDAPITCIYNSATMQHECSGPGHTSYLCQDGKCIDVTGGR